MFRENPDKLCLCGITTALFTDTEPERIRDGLLLSEQPLLRS